MERLYRGLVWLACATLIIGAVASYMYVSSVFNNTQTVFSVSGSSEPGTPIAVFFQLLATQGSTMALSLSNLLDGGVIILAATLAWATHRRVWLAALILVTLLTVVWPSVAFVWQSHYLAAQVDVQSASATQMIFYISQGVQLIPVALALVFGLKHRETTIATTDATLGIERSAL